MKNPINNKLIIILITLQNSISCISNHPRTLTSKEKERYHLNGVINDARVCPTEFDEKTQSLKVVGTCELVSCFKKDNETQCYATPEQPSKDAK